MSRIDRPRYSVRGEVLATFWPKGCSWYNTRQGVVFLRKGRGWRRRAKERYWRRHAHEPAELSPAEIDHLCRATAAAITRMNYAQQETPTIDMFLGRRS